MLNAYCYIVQPGVSINYANGESELENSAVGYVKQIPENREIQNTQETEVNSIQTGEIKTYILNNKSMGFHKPACLSVSKMKESYPINSAFTDCLVYNDEL